MPPTYTSPPAPARVVQLSLWVPPAAPWHAELSEPGAPARGFDSPFELARFLAQDASIPAGGDMAATATSTSDNPRAAVAPAAGGLR